MKNMQNLKNMKNMKNLKKNKYYELTVQLKDNNAALVRIY